VSRFKWWRRWCGGAWYLWRNPDGRTLWRRESAAWMKLGTTITVGGGDVAFAAEMGATVAPKTTFTNLAVEDYTKGKVTA
jgi:hypothetical protein